MSSLTTLLGLKKHADSEFGWGQSIRDFMDIMDTMVGTEHNTDGSHGAVTADSLTVGGVNVGATDSGTATSVGALDITQTGKNWGTNIFATGHTVTYLSGGNDAVADIASNDADSLTLAGGSAAPDAATPFSIYGNGDPTISQAIDNSAVGEAVIHQNELSNSGLGVWSNSQDLFSTVDGSAPAIGDGNDKLTDGAFASGIADWEINGTGLIAHDGVNFDMDVDRNGGTFGSGANYTAADLVVGKMYEVSVNIKALSHGLDFADNLGNVLAPQYITTGVKTFAFRAKDTRFIIAPALNSGATATVDDMRIHEVSPGIKTGTNGPDGTTKTSTLEVFRHQLDSTRLKGFYGLKAVKGAATAEYLNLTNLASQLAYYSQFTSRTMALGVWVYAEQANNVKAEINDSDGTTADSYATVTTLEWQELSRASGGSITSFTPRILFDGAATDVAYISQPMLIFGSKIGEGNYSAPVGEVISLDDTTLDIAETATPQAGNDRVLNLETLSIGKLPQGLKGVDLEIVTKDSAVADAAGVELGKDSGEQNLRCYPQVNNMSIAASGEIICDSDGNIYQKITTVGNTLSATAYRVKAVRVS